MWGFIAIVIAIVAFLFLARKRWGRRRCIPASHPLAQSFCGCLEKCFGDKRQEGGTCYANAIAAVLHLAMKRIVHRTGGYPDFFDIRKTLIKKHGVHGANTLKVLQEVCPQYRLQCKVVDVIGARKAVDAKRPVIARFRLTGEEWKSFKDFYDKNPHGILTKSDVDISNRGWFGNWFPYLFSKWYGTDGHAVALMSHDKESLWFMNSWGSDWADEGFFRVQNAGLLGLEFFDVFWTLNDLKQEEKDAYARYGPEKPVNLRSYLQTIMKLFSA